MAKVLQGCGVSQLPRSTFVVTDPSEIVRALVGLKDVHVLAYERWGPRVESLTKEVSSSPMAEVLFMRLRSAASRAAP